MSLPLNKFQSVVSKLNLLIWNFTRVKVKNIQLQMAPLMLSIGLIKNGSQSSANLKLQEHAIVNCLNILTRAHVNQGN